MIPVIYDYPRGTYELSYDLDPVLASDGLDPHVNVPETNGKEYVDYYPGGKSWEAGDCRPNKYCKRDKKFF